MDKRIIHSVFEQAAARFPGRIAIREEQEQISYQALNESANRLAHLLCYLGIKKSKIVGVMISGSINLVTALLATFKSGGIYLPVDMKFSLKRITEVFGQSRPDVLVVNDADLEELQGLLDELKLEGKIFIVTLDAMHGTHIYLYREQHMEKIAKGLPEYYTGNPGVQVDPEDENYIFYTSGSTGIAKAFVGCHKSLSHFIHWELKEFDLDESCKVSQLSQFTFDAALRDILLPLSCGGTLCIPAAETKNNTARLIEWINESAITLIHCVPSLFRLLSNEIASGHTPLPVFPKLRYLLMAGEPLFVKDIRDWRERVGQHVEIVNLYGTSETTLAKTFHRIATIEEDPAQAIHAGKPIDNAGILVMNDLVPCGPGETGEVFIRTPFMTKGYYNNPALNEASFINNPLKDGEKLHRTGDIGRIRKDGNLEIFGRIDDQVKVAGIRITLGEIQQAMLAVPGVQEAVVIAIQDETKENRLSAYYTGIDYTIEDWRRQLKHGLNEYAIPSFFTRLEVFPLTSNGKIDKQALPQPDIPETAEDEAPQGALEEELAQIWSDILQNPQRSRTASFLKIGGTSLKAIQLISRIYKQYKVLLKINDIFGNTTIAQQAVLISSRKAGEDKIPPAPVQEYYPLSHSQKRLWMMEQLEQEQTAYNIPGNFELTGKLDRQALEQAFAMLIERHEILRTSFVLQDGIPRSHIRTTAAGFNMAYTDMRDNSEALDQVRQMASEELRVPFNLEEGFLFRVRLLAIAEEHHVLLFTVHHIITDGWSFNVMVRDLLAFYEAGIAREEAVLPALPIQYKDYTLWLDKKLAEQKQQNQEYWLRRFEEPARVLNLPTDFARPLVKSTRGALYTFILPEQLVTGMKAVSRPEEASLYMFLLSAVNILLYSYSGQQDLIVGAPIAGRVHKDLEHQVGLYVNLLAIRTQMEPQQTFRELLAQVKGDLLKAYDHQLYPFDQLVQELKMSRDESRSALTDVWVQHSDAHWGGISANNPLALASGLQVHDFKSAYTISKVDLTFMFTDIQDKMEVVLQYNTDLFTTESMHKVAQDLESLIESIVADPNQSLISCIRTLAGKTVEPDMINSNELLSTDY